MKKLRNVFCVPWITAWLRWGTETQRIGAGGSGCRRPASWKMVWRCPRSRHYSVRGYNWLVTEKERKYEFKAICPFGLTPRKTEGGIFTEGIVWAKPPDVTAVSILDSDSPDEERAAKRLTWLNGHEKTNFKMFSWIESTAEIHFSYS